MKYDKGFDKGRFAETYDKNALEWLEWGLADKEAEEEDIRDKYEEMYGLLSNIPHNRNVFGGLWHGK